MIDTQPLHADEYWQEDGGYVVRCRCGWEHWVATHMRAMDFFAEHVCEVLGWDS